MCRLSKVVNLAARASCTPNPPRSHSVSIRVEAPLEAVFDDQIEKHNVIFFRRTCLGWDAGDDDRLNERPANERRAYGAIRT